MTPAGVWEPSTWGKQMQTSLIAILTALVRHPAETAATYGKLTGKCSFCHSELSADNSTDVGYGPVCAKRWGPPWGKK